MTSRTITKVLITQEDLALGQGTTSQTRQGASKNVTQIDLPWVVTSIVDVQRLDTTKYKHCILDLNGKVLLYRYDSTSAETVDNYLYIAPNVGSGQWTLAQDLSASKQAANYTELRAIDTSKLIDDTIIEVASRSTVDDGGGGAFVWSDSDLSSEVTSDAQSGIYVAPDSDLTGASGAYIRRFSGDVYPEWFGALGDSSNDDSTAIKAADLQASVRGLGVHFADKVYAIESTAEKQPPTVWHGTAGSTGSEPYYELRQSGTTIYSKITNSDPAVRIVNSAAPSIRFHLNSGLRDISIQGDMNQYSTTNSALLIDANVRGVLLDNFQIRHFSKGIEYVSGGQLFGNRLQLSHCKYTLYLVDVSDSWFTDCHFGSSIANSGINNATYFANGAGVYHNSGQNLKFIACRLQVQYQGAGGEFIGTRGLQFDKNCMFDLNGRDGLTLYGCNDVTVNGYFFKNNNENSVVSPSPGTKYPHLRIRATGETFTADPATDILTVSGTFRHRGVQVTVSSTGTLPGGLAVDTVYWVGYETLTTKKLYTNERDMQAQTNPVNITSAGSGTHSLHQYVDGIEVSAMFNGLIGETEDAGACVLMQANALGGSGGVIAGVTISGCSKMAADYAMDFELSGTGSQITGVTFDNNAVDSRTTLADGITVPTGYVKIGDSNSGFDEIVEMNDANVSWRKLSGYKAGVADVAITALRFFDLKNDACKEGDKFSIRRKGAGASAVRVRDDSNATLVDIAVDERADFLFTGGDWKWNGTIAI